MSVSASKCPCCGAPYKPSSFKCDFCGSYVILSKEKFLDLSQADFQLKQVKDEVLPGIYIFSKLLDKGEKPIVLGVANYFTGVTSAGGKLLLTNKNLFYSAHRFNAGRPEAVISLDSITHVEVVKNMLVTQSILVSTTSENHKFVVNHGNEWVDRIQEARLHEHEVSFSSHFADDLRQLKALFDEGIITEEEFTLKKRMMLGL